AVGGGDAVCRRHRQAPRDRLVDGHRGVGAGRLSVAAPRPADRRDDCLYIRSRPRYDGHRASALSAHAKMKCRNCGAEIADKAVICYRCGPATTEAKYQPVPLRGRRNGPNLIVVLLVILLLILAAAYYFHVR